MVGLCHVLSECTKSSIHSKDDKIFIIFDAEKVILLNLIIFSLKIKLHTIMKLNYFSTLSLLIAIEIFSCSNKSTKHIDDNQTDNLNEISNANLALSRSDLPKGYISDASILRVIEKLNNDPEIQSNLKEYHSMYTVGNWRGKGELDTLSEHYYSRLKGSEMISPWIYNWVIDYDSTVAIAGSLLPVSYLVSNDNLSDTLFISDNQQLFGLLYLKNEGDLDDDGGDELGFVINYADWSNINTYYIATNKKGKWHLLYSFPIWEWQLEEQDDLVERIGNKKIKVIYRNPEAEEDIEIVDLSKARLKSIKRLSLGKD